MQKRGYARKAKVVGSMVTVNQETGEVTSMTTTTRYPAEPEFVKLYLDAPKGSIDPKYSVLLALLNNMGYSDGKECGNGIYINKPRLEQMSKETGLSEKRLRNLIRELQAGGFLRRVALGQYQVNPYLFGKGEWVGVAQLRDSWPLT